MLFSTVLSIALMVLCAIAAPPPFTASNLASRTTEPLHNHRHHRDKTISAPLPFATMTTVAFAIPSAIHRRTTTTVPSTCSMICNNAMNEAQTTETSALCEAGSAFQLDLSACKACVAAQGGHGATTRILSGDFMTMCPVTTTVPTTCSMECNNAMVASQSMETSALCKAGSPFQGDLSACKACVAAHGDKGEKTLNLSGAFMTICSETGKVGVPPTKAPGPVVAPKVLQHGKRHQGRRLRKRQS